MTMAPGLRRATFTTHITSSVGWLGAVIVFLALAVIGLISQDEVTVRGAYLLMAPAAWFVLVPLAQQAPRQVLTSTALALQATSLAAGASTPRLLYKVTVVALVAVLLFIILHWMGGGLPTH